MNKNNEEYKNRLLDLIVHKNNGVLTYQHDYGIFVMCELLCTQLYNKHFIGVYPISTYKDSFGKIEKDYITATLSTKSDPIVNDETKRERVNIKFLETLNNFKENIVTISGSVYLLPFDTGMVKLTTGLFTSLTGDSGCGLGVSATLTIYTWTEENAIEIAEFISDGLVIAPTKHENKNTYQMAIQSSIGISLRSLKFRPVECNIKENYNDDLPYDDIIKYLTSDKQELLLLYGTPGTGKTTLIKHLINLSLGKQVIVFDTNIISTVGDDKFLKFLSDNANSIIIMEDCDKVLSTREEGNPIMSSILNLTDGLIGESFNIKFICTFNTSEKKIDEALLRKGRLSLMYKFRPLTVDKVRHFIPDATKEMTIGDIFNQKDNIIGAKNKTKIGFNATEKD